MRILLTAGATEPTPATILIIRQEAETVFETISGDAYRRGVVAEVEHRVVGAAIAAAMGSARRGRSPSEVFEDADWLARALSPYEPGSEIGLEILRNGWTLDTSRATWTDRAPGVSEGDVVVIGPPMPESLVNARGRVASFREESVWVDLDPADRERIERSTARKLPPASLVLRYCIEAVS